MSSGSRSSTHGPTHVAVSGNVQSHEWDGHRVERGPQQGLAGRTLVEPHRSWARGLPWCGHVCGSSLSSADDLTVVGRRTAGPALPPRFVSTGPTSCSSTSTPSEIIRAVRLVAAGDAIVSPSVTRTLLS